MVWALICSWSHSALCSSTLPALRTCPWTVYECMTMSVDLQLIPCSAAFKYIAGFEDMSMDCLWRYECWFAADPMQRSVQVHCRLWGHVQTLLHFGPGAFGRSVWHKAKVGEKVWMRHKLQTCSFQQQRDGVGEGGKEHIYTWIWKW